MELPPSNAQAGYHSWHWTMPFNLTFLPHVYCRSTGRESPGRFCSHSTRLLSFTHLTNTLIKPDMRFIRFHLIFDPKICVQTDNLQPSHLGRTNVQWFSPTAEFILHNSQSAPTAFLFLTQGRWNFQQPWLPLLSQVHPAFSQTIVWPCTTYTEIQPSRLPNL